MICGIQLDSDSRCIHYHQPNDVAAMECGQCHQYFACYQCHDLVVDHDFVPITTKDTTPVMCGRCKHRLTYEQYQEKVCPYCFAKFNPKCELHEHLYFKE